MSATPASSVIVKVTSAMAFTLAALVAAEIVTCRSASTATSSMAVTRTMPVLVVSPALNVSVVPVWL